MSNDDVLFQCDNHVAVIALNRPERLNAYTTDVAERIHELLDQIEKDLDIRAVVLHGTGRGFCAGLDMKEGMSAWPAERGPVQSRYTVQQRLAAIALRLREIPQPVVAAVHGPAVGGGLALAAACDIRVADTSARFQAAFVRLGLSGGDDGVTWFLPRIVGVSAAADILFRARFVESDEALALGLVSQVVPAGQHVVTAMEIAHEIAANPPFGIRMTKTLLNHSLGVPSLRDQLEIENRTQVLAMFTEDFAEGVEAYAQRRGPKFQDR